MPGGRKCCYCSSLRLATRAKQHNRKSLAFYSTTVSQLVTRFTYPYTTTKVSYSFSSFFLLFCFFCFPSVGVYSTNTLHVLSIYGDLLYFSRIWLCYTLSHTARASRLTSHLLSLLHTRYNAGPTQGSFLYEVYTRLCVKSQVVAACSVVPSLPAWSASPTGYFYRQYAQAVARNPKISHL